MPIELHRTVARFLPGQVQGTFYACFALARRTQPKRGYLLRPDLEPLSDRELADLLSLPLATAQRHVSVLIDRRVMVRDLARQLIVPLVIETERRFASRTTTRPETAQTTQTTSGENGDAPYLPEVAPIPGLDPPNGRKPEEWVSPSLVVSSSDRERRYVASIEEAGENLDPDGARFLGDEMAALADVIADPTVRFMVVKLRREVPAWRGFPSAERDVALLERLQALAPGALIGALEQESLSPTAKRPGAWLSRTVPAIAAGQEVAS